MAKWRVIATVQSKGNDPVEIKWLREGSEMAVMTSVAQLFGHDEDYHAEENSVVPFPELLSIKIEKV